MATGNGRYHNASFYKQYRASRGDEDASWIGDLSDEESEDYSSTDSSSGRSYAGRAGGSFVMEHDYEDDDSSDITGNTSSTDDSSDVIDLGGVPLVGDSTFGYFGLVPMDEPNDETAATVPSYDAGGHHVGNGRMYNTNYRRAPRRNQGFFAGPTEPDDDDDDSYSDDSEDYEGDDEDPVQSEHVQRRLSRRPGDGNEFYTTKNVPIAALRQQQQQPHAPAEMYNGTGELEEYDILSDGSDGSGGSVYNGAYSQPRRAARLGGSSGGLQRTDSQSSIRSTVSHTVLKNKVKRCNIVPYSGGNGLKDPLGVNWTGKDRPDLPVEKKKKDKKGAGGGGTAGRNRKRGSGASTVRQRNMQRMRGRSVPRRAYGNDSDEDDDDEDEDIAKSNTEWYRGVARAAHEPYGARGREESREEREKRLEKEWKLKQKELQKEEKAKKKTGQKTNPRSLFQIPRI